MSKASPPISPMAKKRPIMETHASLSDDCLDVLSRFLKNNMFSNK